MNNTPHLSVFDANCLNLIASQPLGDLVPQLLDKLSGNVRQIGEFIADPGHRCPPEFDAVSNDLRATAHTIKQLINPDLQEFEVRIRYTGSIGYLVKARDEDEAERLAKELYGYDTPSHTAASDTEHIIKITYGLVVH